MSIVNTPTTDSVEGIVATTSGNQRVVMVNPVEGTQTGYSTESVECVVQDAGGHKQRCVCIVNFSDDGSSIISADRLGTLPTSDGNYRLRLTISSGTPTMSWVSE